MTAHPLQATMERLAALHELYQPLTRQHPDTEAVWFPVSQLGDPDLNPLDVLLPRFAAYHPLQEAVVESDLLEANTPPDSENESSPGSRLVRQAHASRWFVSYLNNLMLVVSGCYLLERRIPDLQPDAVWVRFDEKAESVGLAWRSNHFIALYTDPQCKHPDCIPAESEQALRDRLRRALVDHLFPLIEALAARSSFGKPGLWALAADYVAKTMLWIGQTTDNELAAVEEARAIQNFHSVSEPWSPLYRRRDFILFERDGETGYLLERTACCLKRKLHGKTNCATCPHRPVAERIELALSGKE